MNFLKKYILVLFITFLPLISLSQDEQGQQSFRYRVPEREVHSPHRATMYSAVLPGLGQAYNKKYWKIPVIYGLAGTFVYLIDYNNKQYVKYKNAYSDMNDGLISQFEVYTNTEILGKIKDSYRRDRDFNIILLSFTYVLNIIDATVDAHLYNYEINDDLSLRLEPTLMNTTYSQNTLGISCSFKF